MYLVYFKKQSSRGGSDNTSDQGFQLNRLQLSSKAQLQLLQTDAQSHAGTVYFLFFFSPKY